MHLLSTLLLSALLTQITPATIEYRLRVDADDLQTLHIEMRHRAPAPFIVAAHAHPEYDDKYWRFIEGMAASGATVTRLDSVRWQVTPSSDVATLRYRVRLPATEVPRPAWRAYLTPTGGIIGGPHSFLYVVGAENARAVVHLDLPRDWAVATALTRKNDREFHADSMFSLMESPIMAGRMKHWQFAVAGVPHHLYYLRGSQSQQFDSTAFMNGVRRLAEQTVQVFRSMPYREYFFLVADDAYGGLEHPNSVTLGARSSELAQNPHSLLPEFAHEFFHTWNLMRIRPAEYRGVDYRVHKPVPGLWFSEGFSIFYADLLQRRMNMTTEHPTRIAHLEHVLARYYNDPGFALHSPERISSVEYNSEPGVLGNSDPSTHLIGELLAASIDLLVRARTDGRRDADDVMRAMNDRFGTVGFTGRDVERVVSDVCACSMTRFFNNHVRGSVRIDFAELLHPFGLSLDTTRVQAVNERGEVERDFRIQAWHPSPSDTLRIRLWNEESIWARGGLNTNDRVLAVNDVAVKTWPEFRSQIVATPIGGTMRFDVVRDGRRMEVPIIMSGFTRLQVRVTESAKSSNGQRALRAEWLAGR